MSDIEGSTFFISRVRWWIGKR